MDLTFQVPLADCPLPAVLMCAPPLQCSSQVQGPVLLTFYSSEPLSSSSTFHHLLLLLLLLHSPFPFRPHEPQPASASGFLASTSTRKAGHLPPLSLHSLVATFQSLIINLFGLDFNFIQSALLRNKTVLWGDHVSAPQPNIPQLHSSHLMHRNGNPATQKR